GGYAFPSVLPRRAGKERRFGGLKECSLRLVGLTVLTLTARDAPTPRAVFFLLRLQRRPGREPRMTAEKQFVKKLQKSAAADVTRQGLSSNGILTDKLLRHHRRVVPAK